MLVHRYILLLLFVHVILGCKRPHAQPLDPNSVGEKVPKGQYYGKTLAVVVGVTKYSYAPYADRAIPTAASDATAVTAALVDHYRYDATNVEPPLTNSDATATAITRAIENTRGQLKEDDAFLFYFSGHGEDGFLIAHDAKIPLQSLLNKIKSLPCKHKLLIVDACYSGTLFRGPHVADYGKERLAVEEGGVGTKLQRPCFFGMSSGRDTVVSAEGRNGLSLFTWALLECMQESAGKHASDDGRFFARPLAGMVSELVASQSNQTQEVEYGYVEYGGGDFLFWPTTIPKTRHQRREEFLQRLARVQQVSHSANAWAQASQLADLLNDSSNGWSRRFDIRLLSDVLAHRQQRIVTHVAIDRPTERSLSTPRFLGPDQLGVWHFPQIIEDPERDVGQFTIFSLTDGRQLRTLERRIAREFLKNENTKHALRVKKVAGEVTVVDTRDERQLFAVGKLQNAQRTSGEISSDGRYVLVFDYVGDRQVMRVFSILGNRRIQLRGRDDKAVVSGSPVVTGERLIEVTYFYARYDKAMQLNVWDLHSGELMNSQELPHSEGLAEISSDGQLIFISDFRKQTISFYDGFTGMKTLDVPWATLGIQGVPRGVAWDAEADQLAIVNDAGAWLLHPTHSPAVLPEKEFSLNGTILAVRGGLAPLVAISAQLTRDSLALDPIDDFILLEVRPAEGIQTGKAVILNDSSLAYVGDNNRLMRCHDKSSGKTLSTELEGSEEVVIAAPPLSPPGDWTVGVANTQRVLVLGERLYDPRSSKEMLDRSMELSKPFRLSFLNIGQLAITDCTERIILQYADNTVFQTEKLPANPEGYLPFITDDVCVTPISGGILFSRKYKNRWKRNEQIRGPQGLLIRGAVALSDRRTLVTMNDDKSLSVWNLEARQFVQSIQTPHETEPCFIELVKGGYVMTASSEGRVCFWREDSFALSQSDTVNVHTRLKQDSAL